MNSKSSQNSLSEAKRAQDNEISARLERVRAINGLTQEQFSNRLGISRGALQHYLKGARELPSSVVLALHNAFKVDPIWLLTGESEGNLSERDKKLVIIGAELAIDFMHAKEPMLSPAYDQSILEGAVFAAEYLVDIDEENIRESPAIIEFRKKI